jgi:hypothetical protein
LEGEDEDVTYERWLQEGEWQPDIIELRRVYAPRVEENMLRRENDGIICGLNIRDNMPNLRLMASKPQLLWQMGKDCGAMILIVYLTALADYPAGIGLVASGLIEMSGLVPPYACLVGVMLGQVYTQYGVVATAILGLIATVVGPWQLLAGAGELVNAVYKIGKRSLLSWTDVGGRGLWQGYYHDGRVREHDWRTDLASWWTQVYTRLKRRTEAEGLLWGEHAAYSILLWLLVLPVDMIAVPHGLNVLRGGVPVKHWIRQPYCAERRDLGHLPWSTHSGFLRDPRRRAAPSVPVMNGDIVELHLRLVIGFRWRVGYGYCHKGNIVTSSHVVPYESLNVNGLRWEQNGRDMDKDIVVYTHPKNSKPVDLAQVSEEDNMFVAGFERTGLFRKELYMFRTVAEIVEDGVVWAQTPISQVGDSGLPVFINQGGSYALAGVAG